MGMEGKKRFAVLLCAEDPDYVKKTYGGYLKVFTALLEDEGEIWDAFRVTKGELPAEEEIEIYDGFVVTGSASDAHADEAWILNLLAFLRRLHALQKRILGICFGHQILSRALGGSIGRASNGWDIGVTCIHRSARANKLLIPPHLPVIQCHRDEVFDLPPAC
ncbi:hypothetical protein HPP92_018244 [Vanilla planifolia]|uniref:Glutamine amidotransferase domain-containing protein n=1 Tax=Vanilla planifolia TaxID=51239 RepID=A0A835QDQ3_VANPL|nr:hypothetical protein HPP92_018244 [Vanilla planifolia]